MADRTCSIDDCERTHYARGWCSLHYRRWWRGGSPHRERYGEIASKTCPGCDTELPLDAFYPSRKHLGGRAYYCRPCARAKRREYYARTVTPELLAHAAERSMAWYSAPGNAERSRDQHRRWARQHKALVNSRNRAWRKANPEQAKEHSRRYRSANPEKGRVHVERRRARKANCPVNDFTIEQWCELLEEFQERCAYCLAEGVPLQQEHMTPLSRGGSHTKSNIVPACGSCNNRKGTRTLIEFKRSEVST